MSANYCLAQEHRFANISFNEGLSSPIVYSVLQDDLGFMWFATQDGGLNRFDGKNMVAFQHDPGNPNSIASNNISDIIKDENGVLWIATWGEGLDAFTPKSGTFVHFKHDKSDASSISDNRVQEILQDSKGDLWLTTFNGGLNKFNRQTGTFTRFMHDPNDPLSLSNQRARSIAEDKDGNIWVSTSNGLNKLDQETKEFTRYFHDALDTHSISGNIVYELATDAKGNLWIGTDKGVDRYVSESNSFEHLTDEKGQLLGEISTIFEDHEGYLWLGTFSNGIKKFDLQYNRIVSSLKHDPRDMRSLSNNDIRKIFEDSSHNLWIGTKGGGVSRLDNKPNKFQHIISYDSPENTSATNTINAIFKDKQGRLWLGTNNGLYWFDNQQLKLTPYGQSNNISSKQITVILQDRSGFIWIGTESGGLNKLNPDTGENTVFRFDSNDEKSISDDYVISLLEDHKGNIWIGTYRNGLNRYNPKTNSFKRFYHDKSDPSTINHNEVSVIFEDKDNTLWIGTAEGISVYQPNTDTFQKFRLVNENNNRLGGKWIYAMLQGIDGELWVGTKDRGLIRINKGAKELEFYTTDSGLPTNIINNLVQDSNGHLWISSIYGVIRFDPKTNISTQFDLDDGLQGKEFLARSSFIDEEGVIYFGGRNGFNIFNPLHIEMNQHKVKVALIRLEQSGVPFIVSAKTPYFEQLVLPYYDNFVSFEFVGLEFTSPEKIQYAYKMEGLDRSWHESGQNGLARYTNLAPGRYVFTVKAANNDDYWTNNALQIPVRVTTPPWKQWWAYITYLSIFVMLIYGVVWFRTIKLSKALIEQGHIKQLLEQSVYDRTQELELANEKLSKITVTDGLTGIPNRRYFDQQIAKEWIRHIRNKQPLTLIMIDIDFFKLYNDLYGHQAGDNCLILVARELAKVSHRSSDSAARYGGEEFVIILPNTDNEGAISVAEEARLAIENLRITHPKSTVSDVVTVSVGTATIIPNNDLSLDVLVSLADVALYKSKENGRNRVTSTDKQSNDISTTPLL
jgi:diguanylate cyclase (GGDEF)-like protein